MGVTVTGPTYGTSDAYEAYNKVLASARAKLIPVMGEGPGGDAAERLAQAARRQWGADIDNGVPPGVALQNAIDTGEQGIQQLIAVNRPQAPAPEKTPEQQAATDAAIASDKDVASALTTYRDTTQASLNAYKNPAGVTAPMPTGIVKPIQQTTVGPAERMQTALQQGVTIGATDMTALQGTAAGQGAGAQAADARQRLLEQRTTQMANGLAAQTRGADRKAGRIAAITNAGEQRTAGGAQLQAQSAADRLAAQSQIANLDSQKQQAQASLEQAKASGDQNAINQAQAQITALDQQAAQFNAGQSTTIQTTNNQQGLQAQGQQETQRVANEELKIKMQEAAQKAAQGLLDENQRQENLAMAKQNLATAEAHYQDAVRRQAAQDVLDQANKDRQFWGNLVASFTSGAAQIGTAAITTSDPRTKENVSPVSNAALHELASAARRSLSNFTYKKGQGDGPGPRAFPMADALEDTELGKTVVFRDANGIRQVRSDRLAVLLALANNQFRKGKVS